MDKTTLKALSEDELSRLEMLVRAEQESRFLAAQKAAEKKRMREIQRILDKVVKVEWNGIKLTLSRSYLPQEGYNGLEYWVQKYSGPLMFNNDNGGAYGYGPNYVRQIAPELVKGDLKLVREYYGLREKVETTEN